jgi:membrane fusion protein, heavy metal efflux system
MPFTPRRIPRIVILIAAVAVVTDCGPETKPEAQEPTTLDVTSWTEKTELFMEHPPFVAGQNVRFAVHLTRLADFTALNTGKPTIELTPEAGGSPLVLPGTDALRPGAFRVEGTLPAAGRYRWALTVSAPGLTDRHDLGTTTIFADQTAAEADAAKHSVDDPAAVSYLKEQQWTNPFSTVQVRPVEMRSSIRIPATVAPLAGGEAVVAAPAAGRFTAASLLTVGTMVVAGRELGRVEPRLSAGEDRAALVAEIAQATLAAEAAQQEQARAEGLLADRAVPARRVEEARRAVASASARLEAAKARLTQRDQTLRSGGGSGAGNAFVLRAPIAGRVAEVTATLGASVAEGAPLFRIVRTDRVEIRTHVPPSDVLAARTVSEIAFEVPGLAEPIPLRVAGAHDPGVIDPRTGALPVVFDVANATGQLLIGQAGTAILYRRERAALPAIPTSAVLMQAGRPYVWVQTSGESFARRYIEIGARDAGLVGIRAGLKPGDRVVLRGAYEVQLASAARGLAAEGHVH